MTPSLRAESRFPTNAAYAAAQISTGGQEAGAWERGSGNGARGALPAGVRPLAPGGFWLLGCLLPGICGFGRKEPTGSCVASAGVWRNGAGNEGS